MAAPSQGWGRAWRLLTHPFWDRRLSRPRALWRLALFLLARAAAKAVLAAFALQTGLLQASPTLTSVTISALATLAPALLCALLLDRRSLRDMGLPPSHSNWAELGLGLALGAALMTLIFCLGLACGWLRIAGWLVGYQRLASALSPLAIWVLVGIAEEVLVRGYLLVNLAEGLHGRRLPAAWALAAAWLLTSVYFGALHADNPSATWLSTAAIMVAGLFLGLGLLLTGRLGLPIGLHITWNLFQGTIYGLPVSGWHVSPFTVISTASIGPTLWTGGAFGPEAGLLGALAMAVGIVATLAIARVRHGRLALATALADPPASAMNRHAT